MARVQGTLGGSSAGARHAPGGPEAELPNGASAGSFGLSLQGVKPQRVEHATKTAKYVSKTQAPKLLYKNWTTTYSPGKNHGFLVFSPPFSFSSVVFQCFPLLSSFFPFFSGILSMFFRFFFLAFPWFSGVFHAFLVLHVLCFCWFFVSVFPLFPCLGAIDAAPAAGRSFALAPKAFAGGSADRHGPS